MKIKKFLAVVFSAAVTMSVLADETVPPVEDAQAEESASWIPTVTLNNSIVKGYYDRGILWDTNTGFEASLNFNDLFIKNLNLDIYVRLPIDRSNYSEESIEYVLDEKYFGNPGTKSKKAYADDARDSEFDNYGIKLGYNFLLHDLKLIGDVNLSISYRLQRNADIYSDVTYKFEDFEDWHGTLVSGDEAVEYVSGGIRDRFAHRREIEQDFSFGISLDSVPYVTPNASFTINQDAKFFIQLGLRNSLPCDFISEKLNWNNTIDFYYMSSKYLSYKNKWKSHYHYFGVDDEVEDYNESFYGEHKANSSAGFKNAIWRTSLDYAFTERVNLSLFGMIVQQLHSLTNDDKYAFPHIHKTEFLYGATLSVNF